MFGKKSSEIILNQSGRSYIAETMQIEGDVHSSGAVDIAGLIDGNVWVDEMFVYETGSVKGNLNAKKVNINGHVDGQIVADVINLGSSAIIKGDILFKETLKTEEGAEIDGYIKGAKTKKKAVEEDSEIEQIEERAELGKPTLVKINNKKVI